MGKITLDMSEQDVLIAMSENNIGALNCLLDLKRYTCDALFYILCLDTLGIYGCKLYILYNDCCKRNIVKMIATIEAFQRGEFTSKEIFENINRRPQAFPFV